MGRRIRIWKPGASYCRFPNCPPTEGLAPPTGCDGSGYPAGFKKSEILLEARILCVADVVEAITSNRPYRAALGLEVALDEITRYRGIKYDEDVVDACLSLFFDDRYEMPVPEGASIV
jgi:HD-GYP domain-containing protein (c-di-GMP phosphodiesterase class II)